MKKILFIINPISGKNRCINFNKLINKNLDHALFSHAVKYTTHPNHATELALEAVKNKIDIVAAVGGDGTVNEVATALLHSHTALAIVPVGSGNGLARHLKISLNPQKAIRQINLLKTDEIDAAKVNDFFFFNTAGIGFDAEIAFHFNQQKTRGIFKYIQLILCYFFKTPPFSCQIETENQTLQRTPFFITFANSSQWGNNAQIAPLASMNDGLMNICICKKPKFYQIIPFLILLMCGKFHRYKNAEHFVCKSIKITSQDDLPFYLHVDGDTKFQVHDIQCQIIEKALKVVM